MRTGHAATLLFAAVLLPQQGAHLGPSGKVDIPAG
jgi:hypothetical protein